MDDLGQTHSVQQGVSKLIDYGVTVLAYRKLTGPPDTTGDTLPTSVLGMHDYFVDLAQGSPQDIAEHAEGIYDELAGALGELAESPPDIAGAEGKLAGAQNKVQDMIDEGFDPVTGQELIDQIGLIIGAL